MRTQQQDRHASLPLRVAIVPRYRGNPYLTQLEEQLTRLGVRVGRFGQSASSTLKGLITHRPHVLHVQWLDAFFVAASVPVALGKMALFFGAVLLLKLLGCRIVWTAHNLRDHENRNPKLDRLCTSFVVRHADAIIAHCQAAKRELVEEFAVRAPEKVVVIPHGHYCDAYPNTVSRAEARDALGVADGTTMLLFLGQIRPYKGVSALIDAFRTLDLEGAELFIVGQVRDERHLETLQRKVHGQPGIRFEPVFVPDEQMQVYLNACDAVMFPYRDILTSGAVVLAMSFGRACVAPRLGCIPEALDERGAILYDPDDPGAFRSALAAAVERKADLAGMGEHNRRRAEEWRWDLIAKQTLAVYRGVCSGGPPRREQQRP